MNASGFGLHHRTQAFRDGETLDLGKHKLRFLETPHVHHWDSMMVVEDQTNSLFPSDLYLQPGEQPAVTGDNLADEMLEAYRMYGICAHEDPVRAVVRQIEELRPTCCSELRRESTCCAAAISEGNHATRSELSTIFRSVASLNRVNHSSGFGIRGLLAADRAELGTRLTIQPSLVNA